LAHSGQSDRASFVRYWVNSGQCSELALNGLVATIEFSWKEKFVFIFQMPAVQNEGWNVG
jgi:hypothetical protein